MVTTRSTGSRADGFRTRFNNYLSEFGTKITLYQKVEIKDSMNRLISTTETIIPKVKCDIQYVTKQDLLHLNLGDVQIGDGMLFVKYNQSIDIHNEVELPSDDIRWRIISQIEGELVNGKIVYKGFLIRKND